MKTKTRNILIIIGILVVIAVGVVLSIFLNSGNDKVTANPSGTIGNTAGNLNNGGDFVQLGDTVYFSNSYDNGTLYSMSANETDVKKISSDQTSNLLAAGDYLYYFKLGTSGTTGLGSVRTPRAFIRCRLDGSKATEIVRETIITAQLVDNTLYMLGSDNDGSYFFCIDTDKSDRTDLAKYIINPASAYNGKIYYCGSEGDHYLHVLNTSGNSSSVAAEHNMWNVVADNGYVYFMDLDNDYRLSRYSLNDNTVEILTTDRVESFNVGSGYIYYQTMGDNAGLYCMLTDGSYPFIISSGEYSDINMTSQYVYFKDYFDENTTYHAPLGSGSYSAFTAAALAVVGN